MTVNSQQIKELLGNGLSNEVVASAVGCDPSYITQLMSADDFRAAVVELRTKNLQADSKRDTKLGEIEDQLINKLEDNLDMIHKPTDILRAFAVVNAAKRRGVPAHQSLVVNQQIVQLNMPTKIVQQFVKNVNGEVVEVEGQTLTTMPARNLLQHLASKGGNSANYEKVARHIPASSESSSG